MGGGNKIFLVISGKIRISRGKFGFEGKYCVKFGVMGLRQWQYWVICQFFQNHQRKLLYMSLCPKKELFGRIYTHGNVPFIVVSIFSKLMQIVTKFKLQIKQNVPIKRVYIFLCFKIFPNKKSASLKKYLTNNNRGPRS